MNTSLLRIETRRNIGLWLWPLLVGLALFVAYAEPGLAGRVTFWVQASVLVRDGLLIVGPALGGAAAWMGSRERRRKIDDLLATTPRPAWARWSVTWAATAFWGALAYAVAGAYMLALAVRHTDWGGPVAWPMLVGLVAVPAYGAVGYALGSLLPSRFTAPLVAIALLALPVVVGSRSGTFSAVTKPSALDALHYLSPVATLDASVWYGVRPDVGWPQALFLLGLTGLALGGLALRGERGRAAWSALLTGGALVVVAVAILLSTSPPGAVLLGASRFSNAPLPPLLARYDRLIPYTPICTGAPVPVCGHPAYRSYLASEAPVINRLIAPLAGLPGVPLRAEQLPHSQFGITGRVLTILPDNANSATDQYFFGPIAQALVASDMYSEHSLPPGTCPGDPTLQSCTEAQDAIGIWLVRQAGLRLTPVTFGNQTPTYPYFGSDWAVASAAATRFAALGRERQRAWLLTHYVALNQGRVRLRDISCGWPTSTCVPGRPAVPSPCSPPSRSPRGCGCAGIARRRSRSRSCRSSCPSPPQ